MENVTQMLTTVSSTPITLGEVGVWVHTGMNLVIETTKPKLDSGNQAPTLGVKMTRLTALFVAECVGAISAETIFGESLFGGNLGNTGGVVLGEFSHDHSLNHEHHIIRSLVQKAIPVDVRITVDGNTTNPYQARFCGTSTEIASYSFLAIVDGLDEGKHNVEVSWRTSGIPGALMRNRTLTVWETTIIKQRNVVAKE